MVISIDFIKKWSREWRDNIQALFSIHGVNKWKNICNSFEIYKIPIFNVIHMKAVVL